MSLPMIKVPKFSLKLPISGKEIKARPFLIREQKILLQAMEIGSIDEVTLALNEIMSECTFNEINIDELSVPDVEYLMLHLRAKSVGESIDMTYTCHNDVEGEDCNTKIELSININDIRIKENNKHNSKLIFDGGIGILLRNVPYGEYKKNIENETKLNKSIRIRNSCIDSIFDENRVWTRNEFTETELNEFIDNLYTTDYEKIEEFISTMPILEHSTKLKCGKCKHTETITLRGLDDFLE